MGSSKYAAKLLDSIKRWERNLNTVGEVFDAWINVRPEHCATGGEITGL